MSRPTAMQVLNKAFRSASTKCWALAASMLAVGGCYQGSSELGPEGADAGEADDEGEAGDDGQGGIDAACSEGATARVAPLRRMTDVQYRNTVEDLFDGAVLPSSSFPTTLGSTPYSSYPEANHVTQLGAEAILVAAEDVAAQVVDNFAAVVPCAGTDDSSCADEFIDSFGRRAFRRPLREEEVTLLRGLYDQARGEGPFEDAIGQVIAAVLQMPQFLYLVEEGEPTEDDGVVRLTSFEIASRLSYLLWDTMPDDALLDAAGSGELDTREQIEAQARRLLSDARAEPMLTRFTRQWLEVGTLTLADKDLTVFPEYDETLMASMEQELDRFVVDAYRSGEGSLQALLTSRETMVNAPLAALYGVDSGSSGPDDWQPVTLPGDRRAGVLTMPAVISANSAASDTSVIFRGKMLRTQALCQDLPPPPAELEVPEFPADASEREKSDILMAEDSCGTCHALINPLGLAFENYDPIGRFRTQDEFGNEIDASGEVLGGPEGIAGQFEGAPQFAEMVATSDSTAACMTTQWMRYSYGRRETTEERCVVDSLTDHFIESGYDLQELLVAFTQTEGFRYRQLENN